jgi:hypothetical protein
MNQPQRYLIVAFLCGIAAAGPIFCLQYRSTDYWGTGGRVFNGHFALPIPPIIALSETEVVPPNRSRHPLSSMSDEELKAAYVNLTYCEGLGTGDARNSVLCASGVTRITGIYPRRGLTFLAAAVGGLLAPIMLLVAGAYVALAARSRNGAPSRPDTPSPIDAPFAAPKPTEISSGDHSAWESRGSDPRAARGEGLYRTVAIAGVVAPLFWVIDMPSMLLMMGARFPRWVFSLLVLRSFGY